MTNRNSLLVEIERFIEELGMHALDEVGLAVIGIDSDYRIAFINDHAVTMTDWSAEQAIGKRLDRVFLLERQWSEKSNPPGTENKVKKPHFLVNRKGQRRPVHHSRTILRDQDGEAVCTMIVFLDASEQSLVEQEPIPWAERDTLTGFFNRQGFTRHLESAIKTFEETSEPTTLCSINLNHFMLINDTCGHKAGDALLRWVSSLLRESTGESDVLSRLASDEFGVLLAGNTVSQAEQFARKLQKKLRVSSFDWEDRSFAIGIRFGIIPVDEELKSVDDILFATDHAGFQAAEMGGCQIYVYRSADSVIRRRQKDMNCAAAMKRNLELNRFELFGQAIRPMTYQHIDRLHFEVLLRPRTEEGKLGSPANVIRAAEKYGGMELLDRWIIRNTLQILKKRASSIFGRLDLCSINLSAMSLKTEGLLEYIHEQIADSAISPAKICFEITETAAVNDLNKARWLIEGVSAIGCRFALDDFGTGMASYGYLKDLPVDFLKIDGVFIKDLITNSLNKTIVDSINQIGHFLGIKTIAEFVGNQSIFEELQRLGVDYAQGYWTGKPMPLHELLGPNSIPPLPPPSNKK
ncbi:MAG: EAL domain-containing protein [Deltaproteobacteria bacterium]|nr:EAL domain-containing protein [Deltaproteobacteria bacterium]